ncbi:MAG: hypothetical protein JNL28_00270 [Planctomycetes bacterium]|nr:hypothetical protein [Planctomycetota bacterium]
MRRTLVILALLACACSPAKDTVVPRSFVTAMSIENAAESKVTCETGVWRGTITIDRGVKIDYANVTTTTNQATESKTLLKLNDVQLAIEREGLRFGEKNFVKLAGDVTVAIRPDGVYVGGAKVAELSAK